jgi:hypothetical protein
LVLPLVVVDGVLGAAEKSPDALRVAADFPHFILSLPI